VNIRTYETLKQILANQGVIMSGLTDLQAAIAALQQGILKILADIATALQNDDPDAAVEDASQLVTQATAQLAAGDPLNVPPPASAPVVVTPPAS
jgi:hypothetical protein